MSNDTDDDESRTSSLGRKRSLPSSSQIVSRHPSSSPENENGPMLKRPKLDVNERSDWTSIQPHDQREAQSRPPSRFQDDESSRELQLLASEAPTNRQELVSKDHTLESGLEDMAVQTRAMAAASGDNATTAQQGSHKSVSWSEEKSERSQENEGSKEGEDDLPDPTTAKAKGAFQKYSNEQLAVMREDAVANEEARNLYILAFERNRAYDILFSPLDPNSIVQLSDQRIAVLIRTLTGKTKKKKSRLAPGLLTKHLNVSIAQKASDGLIQYHTQSLIKNKQHLTLLIYSSKVCADAALASLLGGDSEKRTKHIESAVIVETAQQLRGYAFNSSRLHCLPEFAQILASNIQESLRSGRLLLDDYGALHDPPDLAIPPTIGLSNDLETLSKFDKNVAEREVDESERLRSEVGVTTSSEGEISDGEQDSTLITNVTETKLSNDMMDTWNALQPPPLTSVPLSEMANIYTSMPGPDIEREQAKLFQLGEEERELQERYWGLKHPDEFVRCLVCGRQGHVTSTCASDVCAHCHTREDHLSHTCPLRPRCGRCQQGGHTEHECPFGSKRADNSAYCEKCSQLGHDRAACPHLWRTFYPDSLENVRKTETIRLSCYQCGGLDHLGGDCSFISSRQSGTAFNVFSAEEANKYLSTPIASSPLKAPNRSRPPPSALASANKKNNQLPKRARDDVGIMIKGAAEPRNHDDGMSGINFPHPSRNAGPGRMQMRINPSTFQRDSDRQADRYHLGGQPRNGVGYNGGDRYRSKSPEPRLARFHRDRGPPKNHWPPPPSIQANANSNPGQGRGGGGGGGGGGRGRGRGRARGRGNR